MDQSDSTVVFSPPVAGELAQLGRGFKKMRSVIWALVLKEFLIRLGYGRLGLVWLFLEPIFAMLMMSAIWTIIGRTKIEGTPVMLFIGSGFAMFLIVQKGYARVATAISANLALLNYPQVKPLDTVVARFILEMWLHASAVLLMFFGLWWLGGFAATFPDPLACIQAIGSALLLSIGIGLPLAVFGALYEAVIKTVNLVTRPLMLFSAVLYSVNDVPPTAREVLIWNPIIHIIQTFRYGAFGTKYFVGHTLFYPTMLGLVLLAFGLIAYYGNRYRLVQL